MVCLRRDLSVKGVLDCALFFFDKLLLGVLACLLYLRFY